MEVIFINADTAVEVVRHAHHRVKSVMESERSQVNLLESNVKPVAGVV